MAKRKAKRPKHVARRWALLWSSSGTTNGPKALIWFQAFVGLGSPQQLWYTRDEARSVKRAAGGGPTVRVVRVEVREL